MLYFIPRFRYKIDETLMVINNPVTFSQMERLASLLVGEAGLAFGKAG